jgi:hypothetical protein
MLQTNMRYPRQFGEGCQGQEQVRDVTEAALVEGLYRAISSRVESFYTVRIGPGYCATKESLVSSVMPSTVACATRTRSKGSL